MGLVSSGWIDPRSWSELGEAIEAVPEASDRGISPKVRMDDLET